MSGIEYVGKVMKWAYLSSLSQTTYMIVWLSNKGKCVIKFVVNSSQSLTRVGIG